MREPLHRPIRQRGDFAVHHRTPVGVHNSLNDPPPAKPTPKPTPPKTMASRIWPNLNRS
jgi:hypothetical protein